MENGTRIQITLTKSILEKLDELCREKGLRRSAVIALALNELWKEENADER